MKFFDIRSYVICYVYIICFGNLSTICAYHVRLLVSVTPFVSRFCTELVVNDEVGIDKQCYCVVNSCPAYSELVLLFKHFEQIAYFKVAVERVYRIEYGESFRGAPAFVFL